MKKVCIALLFVSALFALFFELRGLDRDNRFSFAIYLNYVSENWAPFPVLDIKGNWASYWFDNIVSLTTYLHQVLGWALHNVLVLTYGFFTLISPSIPSPDNGQFGGFGGGGFGGGGGGAR